MTRDDLIDKVQYGVMTPDEAEAEAELLGLRRLASHGDKTLDPLREPDWTLPMAAAWIAYRTSDAVRGQWDDYRLDCWEWRFRKWRVGFDGPVHEGHFLEQCSRATLAKLSISDSVDQRAARDPLFSMTVQEAIDALWIALRGGATNRVVLKRRRGSHRWLAPRRPAITRA
ncbi:MAG: hypothetical protein Q7T45_07310 [Bradyrhizobium sp.]|uniref:hypothetical protein n=1 Tax=Bradyrhizobium sp. TaxID=376 RepID=UPI002722A76A|nr:hypothetical protein [Bradyrhizobium sp.]MDO8397611.1 hypothetical protein [Bradyrhizobium sp.]